MLSEKELLDKCVAGDDAGWRSLFDRYLPIMHAICLRYVGSSAEADDLVQEGFVKVFSNLSRFSWNGPGSFIGWMKTIFVNHSINAYKKNAKNMLQSIDATNSDIEEKSDDEADSVLAMAMDYLSEQEIIGAIAQLPEQFRVVFNMFAVDGLKHKEIAEALGIPLKTSTTRYMRAKLKMKKILNEIILLKTENQQVG